MLRNRTWRLFILLLPIALAVGCFGRDVEQGDATTRPPRVRGTPVHQAGVPIETVDERVAVSVAGSEAPAPGGPEARIQGSWIGQVSGDSSERWEWTISGNRIDAKNTAGEFYRGTLAITDRAAAIHVDLRIAASSDASLSGKTIPGIMKIEGTNLTFCFADPEQSIRPTRFDSSEGFLLVGVRR